METIPHLEEVDPIRQLWHLRYAMHADKCEIYTDVDGVYTADPRVVPNARKIEEITYDEMLELATSGAKVLHNRSVEMAKKNTGLSWLYDPA